MCVQCLVESLICISWWLIMLNIFSCAYLLSFIHFGKTSAHVFFSYFNWVVYFLSVESRIFHMLNTSSSWVLWCANISPSLWPAFHSYSRVSHRASHLVVTLLHLPSYPVMSECAPGPGTMASLSARPFEEFFSFGGFLNNSLWDDFIFYFLFFYINNDVGCERLLYCFLLICMPFISPSFFTH